MGRRCGLHTVNAILGGAEVDAAVIGEHALEPVR